MAHSHPYTLASLGVDDPRFVERSPGVAEIERMFPSPSSSGRGRLAIEGGVSLVAGPGMGKTSLLARLSRTLDRKRGLATALVTVPAAGTYPDESGFYGFLGDLVDRLYRSLRASTRLSEEAFQPIAQVLATEPVWDAAGSGPAPHGMTPRGFADWIALLGSAAVHTPGVCLLFDGVDAVTDAAWKGAFVAALRFTFQTSAGITPVYALWSVFADESLPGSNYFRNVTRPFFLEPLNDRRAVIDLGLPTLSGDAAARIDRLVGGHPQLLHRVLGDVCEHITEPSVAAQLRASDIDALFTRDIADAQRALAASLIARTPNLRAALCEIAKGAHTQRPLARGLIATGLVDRDAHGSAVLPERVAEVL